MSSFSALTAGLLLAPMAITSVLAAPIAGRLTDRVHPRVLTLGCDGRRFRLKSLTWRGWNEDVAVGRGAGGVRVRLSSPRECSALDGFIYTRARVQGRSFVIDCPISD